MADGALKRFDQIQTSTTKDQYGKLSNRFVDELKGSTLFQHNWGELLSAAPTALSLMGACWLAASNATAEKISLKESKPVDGFKYMTNVPSPTLRSCLVDGKCSRAFSKRRVSFGRPNEAESANKNASLSVCNNGGRHAFTVAGQNMDALQMTSRRIGEERIPMVFRRLGPSTLGPDQYENFKYALEDFSNDAKACAKFASEIREAFGTWGKMVGELHAVTENQDGVNTLKADKAKDDENATKIEEAFTATAIEEVKKQVTRASKNVEKQQKNLDTMIDKVPGPWASVLQTAVSSFAQALPSMMGAAISARNPAALAAGVAAGQAGAAASNTATAGGKPQTQTPALTDPAYAAAATIQNLVNHYFEYLGGEKATGIKWDKFKESTTAPKETTIDDDPKEVPQGLAYLLGTLKGQKANIDVTDTAPNKKLLGAYAALIKLSEELQAHLRKQNELSASKEPAEDVVKEWRTTCRKARDDIIELAAVAKASGSSNVPTAFGNVQIPPPDLSAQTAQLNTAMQGVQIAQTALDNAENLYQAAVEKQERKAKDMAAIQAKLQRLQSTGKTLEEIKLVLRDCINVLADLIVQIGRLERFFIMLTTVIDVLVMPRAQTFERDLDKIAKRALRSGVLRADEVDKQAIYVSTLQLKAYFSLLQDIATMYSVVHREHIVGGVELCYELSKGASRNDSMPDLQDKLAKYTDNAAAKVAALVSAKQNEMLRTLRARADRAREETAQIEAEMARFGVAPVDQNARRAIESGAHEQQVAARELLKSEGSLPASVPVVARDSENFDANEL